MAPRTDEASPDTSVSDATAERISALFGDQGRAWLGRLPDIVAMCVQRQPLLFKGDHFRKSDVTSVEY